MLCKDNQYGRLPHPPHPQAAPSLEPPPEPAQPVHLDHPSGPDIHRQPGPLPDLTRRRGRVHNDAGAAGAGGGGGARPRLGAVRPGPRAGPPEARIIVPTSGPDRTELFVTDMPATSG